MSSNDSHQVGKRIQSLLGFFGAGVAILVILILTYIMRSWSWHYEKPHKIPAQYCQSTISTMPIKNPSSATKSSTMWTAPNIDELVEDEQGMLIRYGRDLVARTSFYFGKNGTLAKTTNGLNCQNCHLDAGTRPFGNNYSAVFATYPKFRARSGTIETIEYRITDCFERSLNGKAPEMGSQEMEAIKAYILWVGHEVRQGITPAGAGIARLPFMERAADPIKGKDVYLHHCKSCHHTNGQGELDSTGKAYKYPPLWGAESYNVSAGMYRLSHLAGFVKYNMPYGSATYQNPRLTDEEAWDVAAYINSQQRPFKLFKQDWPDASKKPVDYPFPPYADSFAIEQHKYGPFAPIDAKSKGCK